MAVRVEEIESMGGKKGFLFPLHLLKLANNYFFHHTKSRFFTNEFSVRAKQCYEKVVGLKLRYLNKTIKKVRAFNIKRKQNVAL